MCRALDVGINFPFREMLQESECESLQLSMSTNYANTQNHRMVWVGRDLEDHLVLTPCHGQGHLPLDPVAHGLDQKNLLLEASCS